MKDQLSREHTSLPSTDPPAFISILPELAFAALREGEEVRLANHALLRTFDSNNNHGSGWLSRGTAREVLKQGRKLSLRHAQRQLVDGAGSYWDLGPAFVRLYGVSQIARRLDVDRVSRPHLVPTTEIQAGRAILRSTLVATAYRTDDRDGPKSRALVETLTGVPARTQRRYDQQYRHARLVSRISVPLVRGSEWYVRSFTDMYKGLGFYAGSHGELMRRHPDIRTAATHGTGSLQPARRANREIKSRQRPAHSARGQRLPRAYFPLTRGGVRAWVKDKTAFGKVRPRDGVHPLLNYAVGEQRTKRGRVQMVALRVPDI